MEYTLHPDEVIDRVIILTGNSDTLINRVMQERNANDSHGQCSWTKDVETMKRIGEIYITELPEYLLFRNIPFSIINTTGKSIEEVEEQVKILI
jgi:hypothetical protein